MGLAQDVQIGYDTGPYRYQPLDSERGSKFHVKCHRRQPKTSQGMCWPRSCWARCWWKMWKPLVQAVQLAASETARFFLAGSKTEVNCSLHWYQMKFIMQWLRTPYHSISFVVFKKGLKPHSPRQMVPSCFLGPGSTMVMGPHFLISYLKKKNCFVMTQIANPKWQNRLVFFGQGAWSSRVRCRLDITRALRICNWNKARIRQSQVFEAARLVGGDWNIGEMYGVMMVNDG